MQRRRAIKNLGLVAGGIFLLPSCEFSDEKSEKVIREFQLEKSQKELLTDVVSAIIPEGQIPGAGKLKIENFVWIMLKDLYDQDSQLSFIEGLNRFDHEIEQEYSKVFVELKDEQKPEALKQLNPGPHPDLSDPLNNFMYLTKKLTIQGYLQSQYIMTEIMPYELVPGRHGNCQEVEEGKRINIYG